MDVFFRDARYRRFHVELEAAILEKYDSQTERNLHTQYFERTTAAYKNMYYEMFPDGDPLAAEFYFSHLPFINFATSRFCCEHLDELTPELALRYSLIFFYRMFRFEDQELDNIMNQSVALKNQFLIGNDGFHVLIQRKN